MAFFLEDVDEMNPIFIIHSSFGALCSVLYILRKWLIKCLEVGATLIEFLPYLAKIQLTLPCGQKKSQRKDEKI